MKSVVHVITTINRGGAENQLLVLVKEQIMQGFDVSVIYLKGEPELLADFELVGARVLHQVANSKLFKQPWMIRRIAKKSQAIIHAHLPRAELMTLLVPVGSTTVVSRHNAESFFPGAPIFLSNFLSKIISVRVKYIIAISEAVREFLLKQGEVTNKDKIKVVLYGYQQKKITNTLMRKPNKDCWKIGSVSRLSKQKDIPTMIKAFSKVREVIPKASMEIVGTGPLESKMKSITKEMNLDSDIHFLGRTDKVIEFMENLDVFLLTSKYEGFGLVLLEAMDAGVPIVASRNSAIPEVLGSDFPGLCQTGNFEEFAEKILLLRNPKYMSHILQIQAERLAIFSSKIMADKIERLYFK